VALEALAGLREPAFPAVRVLYYWEPLGAVPDGSSLPC
jgi:hypothetical protein